MSNHGETWRKFVQTFFLAEQPNGYFVLNDIFRFLKEESVDDEEGSDAEGVADEASPEPQPATPLTSAAAEPTVQPSALVTPEPVYEQPREATPAPPPAAIVVDDVPVAVAPIEEAPKVPEPVPEPVQAPVPVIEQPTQTVQPNGHASEPEVVVAPTPPAEPSPRPTPPALPAPSLAPSAATTAAAATAPSHPTPAAPRSWASLAASNSKKWGPVAQVSETVAPSSSPGSGSQTPATTTTTPNPSAPQQHHGRPNQRSEHSPLAAAQNVTTAHCFVKVYPIRIRIKMKY